MINLKDFFEEYDYEFAEFGRIKNPRHIRPDICAFLILHDLNHDPDSDYSFEVFMVAHASHQKILLDVDPNIIANKATEEDLIMLLRCGIGLCKETGKLQMYTD